MERRFELGNKMVLFVFALIAALSNCQGLGDASPHRTGHDWADAYGYTIAVQTEKLGPQQAT